MVHQLNINVSKEKFIGKYLQTFNGIFKLNTPEFRVVEFVLNNDLLITKETADLLVGELGGNVGAMKRTIKDLHQKGIFIELESKIGSVINPVVYTGKNQVIINFNIV